LQPSETRNPISDVGVGVADQSQEESTDDDPPGTPLRPLSSSGDEDVPPAGAGPLEMDLLMGSLSDRLEQQELQMGALRGTLGDLVRIMEARFGSEAPDQEQRARGPAEPEAGRAPLLQLRIYHHYNWTHKNRTRIEEPVRVIAEQKLLSL